VLTLEKEAATAKVQQAPASSLNTNGIPFAASDPRIEQLDQKVRNLKLSLNYEHTDFQAAVGNPFDEKGEDVFLTRAQFSF
jgi:hypothetical protein